MPREVPYYFHFLEYFSLASERPPMKGHIAPPPPLRSSEYMFRTEWERGSVESGKHVGSGSYGKADGLLRLAPAGDRGSGGSGGGGGGVRESSNISGGGNNNSAWIPTTVFLR